MGIGMMLRKLRRGIMDNAIARRKEMKWMQSIGIRGIKVDFFGGDKQMTMQL